MRPAPARLGADWRDRRVRLDRGRPRSRVRAGRDVRAGENAPRARRPPQRLREDSRHRSRGRRDRGLDRRRPCDQRHAHLLVTAPRRGRRGVHPRPRAAGGGRGRSDARRLRRELLRLARRQRGRPAARGDRQEGSSGSACSGQREARLPALPRSLRRSALGSARSGRRATAALPLGVDVDEEPGLPRRALRRGAHRAGRREHDAVRDDRRVPGPRRDRVRRSPRASTKRVRCSGSLPKPASTTTT